MNRLDRLLMEARQAVKPCFVLGWMDYNEEKRIWNATAWLYNGKGRTIDWREVVAEYSTKAEIEQAFSNLIEQYPSEVRPSVLDFYSVVE